ncbi:nuclear transport factor 2 family protein [Spirosoma foliorum]|uniref:Nuclear transport factor 2 family protein n=1 Tax=Spirosoma foliorum TaxID=2710596 RepID=A0A7G5GY54_9BACT|nr:nuclear transport factor 2 family protein [Spirosoma foliorum]QMW03796.1 nuclear transport factor 2 family protein [Spirosoma foliorum]
MKFTLTLGLFFALQFVRAQTSVSPSAAASTSFTATSADEKAVIETEKQRFAAQVKADLGVLDRVLANDLVYAHSNGGTDTKQSYLQSIRDGKTKYSSIDIEEQKVRIYGNTAVINGLCSLVAINNGEALNSHLRYISVYVRNAGQWQMVAWQSLKLAK